jgi:methionine-rich copper-binding protein CopC
MKRIRRSLHFFLLAAAFVVLLMAPRAAMAHAVLVASVPSVHGTVKGPDVAVHLKFNSRIDGAHSRLYLVDAAGKVQMLILASQESPDALAAQNVKLRAGAYTIRWQALAADGHITRGEIAFTVQ